jgi:hypothetical protein
VIGLGLRQLQDALHRKADTIQHEFVAASDRLQVIGKLLLEERGEEREKLRSEQAALRERQQALANEINLWRDRARKVLQTRGGEALRDFIRQFLTAEENEIRAAAEHALYVLDASEEELAKMARPTADIEDRTPVARLLQRARTEWDLRGTDPGARIRGAVEFANRAGMAQNMDAIAELETAVDDPDPLVRELVILTIIQLHRFRAMRLADLEAAHQSAQRLAQINHLSVIPVLVELLENPRSGFLNGESGPVEADNGRSRLVALLRLVEWHTAEAQAALRGRKFDRDAAIVRAAAKALELFPGDWSGPLKTTGPLKPPSPKSS